MEPENLILDLEKILKGIRLDEWEIYLVREQGTAVEVKEQNIESFEKEDHLGLALRVSQGGRLGFGYSTDFRGASLKNLVAGIFQRMKESDTDPDIVFPENDGQTINLPEIYDQSFTERTDKDKIEKAMLTERSAFETDSRIKRVRECEYQDSLKEVWILNSRGLNRKGISTTFSLSVSALAEQGMDAQISSEFDWSFQYGMLSPQSVGRGAGTKACDKLGAKPVKSAKTPVIFSPEVSGELMELLSYALSGENLWKNKSWLKGKQGEKIFSSKVTIIDDGLFLKGPECFAFDGEGVSSRAKVLVDKGVVKNFICDSYYGRKLKKGSTANSRRDSFLSPPSVGPSNFYLLPGHKSQEQLIAEVSSGFLVREALGMHTADEISGEFSIGVSGQWIERGRLERAVSGVAIAGTLRELFSRVAEVGSDLKFYHNCSAPSVLIDEMEISGS